MLSLGGLSDGRLSIDLMKAPEYSPVHFDRLFEEARVCLPQLWGVEYPVEELMDDIENYRPLKFVHACQKLKLRVLNFGKCTLGNMDHTDSAEDLWNTISSLGEVRTILSMLLVLTFNRSSTMFGF